MSDRELEQLAADLWAETGLADVYPRGIEQAVALKLPVTIVKLPVVTVQTVVRWLKNRHHESIFPEYHCDLMGCVFANKGHGFIFVCGADSPEEQRYTLGHDTAHFLVDYWLPRERALLALGPSITPVLDGYRPARPEEKVTAVLAHVRIGPHWHIIPRHGSDIETDERVAHAEHRADMLGLELVAPRQQINRVLRAAPECQNNDAVAACHFLADYFGLPFYVFESITRLLVRRRLPTFLEEALRILGR